MIQAVGLHGLDNPKKPICIRSELETEQAPVQFIRVSFNQPAWPQCLSHGRSGERCYGINKEM